MQILTGLVEAFPKLSMDQINAFIALCAIGLAGFAIYAVYEIAKDRRRK